MSEYQILGLCIALVTLIFSGVPFLNLVYAIGVLNVVDGSQFELITGAFVITLLGSTIWRKAKS